MLLHKSTPFELLFVHHTASALEEVPNHLQQVLQLVVLACGRRGGKSLMSAVWAAFDATIRDLRKYQRKGEPRSILLLTWS